MLRINFGIIKHPLFKYTDNKTFENILKAVPKIKFPNQLVAYYNISTTLRFFICSLGIIPNEDYMSNTITTISLTNACINGHLNVVT